MINKAKSKGQIFTPPHIVKLILDFAGYRGETILCKHIIDNSCGEGAFLIEIVRRYISVSKVEGVTPLGLKKQLETYVHGIELDEVTYLNCLKHLNNLADEYRLDKVCWDVRCADTLQTRDYDGKMDFVVGNPPYVRVHNLTDYKSTKQFKFTAKGMTDLYLAFIEIGFEMLKPTGKMCLITPSSWLNSVAGKSLRDYVVEYQNLSGIIDLEHYMPFDATAYTVISRWLAPGSKPQKIIYQTFNGQYRMVVDELSTEEINIGGNFYLGCHDVLPKLRRIREGRYPRHVRVKNGFATLSDKIFISDDIPDDGMTIPILKASTGKWAKTLYPYNSEGKPYELEEIKVRFPKSYQYLVKHEKKLREKKGESEMWHIFGRSQGIKDMIKPRIALNTILIDLASLKINELKPLEGVYSGLYIITEVPSEEIKKILREPAFLEYVKALKQYKSGGYYTFSSRDLELYLNYRLKDYQDGQQSISESYLPLF